MKKALNSLAIAAMAIAPSLANNGCAAQHGGHASMDRSKFAGNIDDRQVEMREQIKCALKSKNHELNAYWYSNKDYDIRSTSLQCDHGPVEVTCNNGDAVLIEGPFNTNECVQQNQALVCKQGVTISNITMGRVKPEIDSFMNCLGADDVKANESKYARCLRRVQGTDYYSFYTWGSPMCGDINIKHEALVGVYHVRGNDKLSQFCTFNENKTYEGVIKRDEIHKTDIATTIHLPQSRECIMSVTVEDKEIQVKQFGFRLEDLMASIKVANYNNVYINKRTIEGIKEGMFSFNPAQEYSLNKADKKKMFEDQLAKNGLTVEKLERITETVEILREDDFKKSGVKKYLDDKNNRISAYYVKNEPSYAEVTDASGKTSKRMLDKDGKVVMNYAEWRDVTQNGDYLPVEDYINYLVSVVLTSNEKVIMFVSTLAEVFRNDGLSRSDIDKIADELDLERVFLNLSGNKEVQELDILLAVKKILEGLHQNQKKAKAMVVERLQPLVANGNRKAREEMEVLNGSSKAVPTLIYLEVRGTNLDIKGVPVLVWGEKEGEKYRMFGMFRDENNMRVSDSGSCKNWQESWQVLISKITHVPYSQEANGDQLIKVNLGYFLTAEGMPKPYFPPVPKVPGTMSIEQLRTTIQQINAKWKKKMDEYKDAPFNDENNKARAGLSAARMAELKPFVDEALRRGLKLEDLLGNN